MFANLAKRTNYWYRVSSILLAPQQRGTVRALYYRTSYSHDGEGRQVSHSARRGGAAPRH
eukprot:3269176-Pleurochrysis_carterae.AAC.1